MVTDADGTDEGAPTGADTTGKTARKLDGVSNAVKSKVDLVTPENTRMLKQGVKVAFTAALTALLLYWCAAYFLEIALFEF